MSPARSESVVCGERRFAEPASKRRPAASLLRQANVRCVLKAPQRTRFGNPNRCRIRSSATKKINANRAKSGPHCRAPTRAYRPHLIVDPHRHPGPAAQIIGCRPESSRNWSTNDKRPCSNSANEDCMSRARKILLKLRIRRARTVRVQKAGHVKRASRSGDLSCLHLRHTSLARISIRFDVTSWRKALYPRRPLQNRARTRAKRYIKFHYNHLRVRQVVAVRRWLGMRLAIHRVRHAGVCRALNSAKLTRGRLDGVKHSPDHGS
jgi:hypothetical protein